MKLFAKKESGLIFVFLLSFLWIAPSANGDETLADLMEVESKVHRTVSRVMPSVVAVTDGQGFGSGVIVSRDGLVLTAGHVMASPFKGSYEVIFSDGRRVKAHPLGKNLNVDAGMIKLVDPGPYAFSPIAEQPPAKGEWVITLGHSGGYDLGRKPPVRTGRVLEHRHHPIRDHQIITDAVLIGGDSGGPLFNLEGEVVAIHSSIGDSIAENRHVSVDTFRKHWARMSAGESWGTLPELDTADEPPPKRAKIGIIVDRAAANAVIKSVYENSPAARAGIRAGDVIIRLDKVPVVDGNQLIELVKKKQPGQGIALDVQRNGLVFRVYVVLEAF